MKILLVGATGTLGRQIAKQAIEDGHEVRCFVRNPRKASFLQEWGCELTKGNLLNSSDIEYALQDIEVVIDAATSKPDDPKSCLLYTSPSPRDLLKSRMPSSA